MGRAIGARIRATRWLYPSYKLLSSLLRQQRERAVPVFRRRVFHVVTDAVFVEIVEQAQDVAVVVLAAALDCGKRVVPVAAAIAGHHLHGEVAQAVVEAGL